MCVLYRVIKFGVCVCVGSVKVCASRPDCFIAMLDLLRACRPLYAVKGKMEWFCLCLPSGCVWVNVCSLYTAALWKQTHWVCSEWHSTILPWLLLQYACNKRITCCDGWNVQNMTALCGGYSIQQCIVLNLTFFWCRFNSQWNSIWRIW